MLASVVHAQPPTSAETSVPGVSPTVREEPSEASPIVLDWLDSHAWDIVIGVIVTLVGGLAYDRFKRRVTVSIVHRQNSSLEENLHALYMAHIDPDDRIAPTHLTHCLRTPQDCIRSAADFRPPDQEETSATMKHLLLVAHCDGEIVGFIKALYVPRGRLLFVAYAAAHSEAAPVARRAMHRLLAELYKLARSADEVSWLCFELTNRNPQEAKARERLFRQHGRAFGLDIRRVDIDYLQPDLDGADIEASSEESAALFLARIGGTTQPSGAGTIRRETLEEILSCIFLDIYLPTWLIARPSEDRPKLEDYTHQLLAAHMTNAPTSVRLR